MKKRTVVLLASAMMILGVGIGGSLAWLLDETETVTNTFTTSDINIKLDEAPLKENDPFSLDHTVERVDHVDDYKMVPGMVLPKDPTVTVIGGSEDCWLFIEVEENIKFKEGAKSYPFEEYILYDIDQANWEPLDGEENVYYCYAMDVNSNRQIKVLGYTDDENKEFHPNKILVDEDVTKEMMEALDGSPTLTFTAYAAQYWKSNDEPFTVGEAWKLAKGNASQVTE